MRKFIVVGILIVAVLAVSAASILAQDATPTPAPDAAAGAAWLGIAVVEHDSQVVIIRVQAGSPANAADLLIGDAIVSYNGTAIDTPQTLVDQLKDAAPGDKVTLELLRNGESVSADVTLGPSPASIMGRGMGGRPGMNFGGPFSGEFDFAQMGARLLGVELNETDAGYEVTSVNADRNPFELKEGDVINTLNGQDIKELDFRALAEGLAGMDEPKLTLGVTRDGDTVELSMAVSARGFGRGFGQMMPFGQFGHGFPFGNRGPRGNDTNNGDTSAQDNSILISGQV